MVACRARDAVFAALGCRDVGRRRTPACRPGTPSSRRHLTGASVSSGVADWCRVGSRLEWFVPMRCVRCRRSRIGDHVTAHPHAGLGRASGGSIEGSLPLMTRSRRVHSHSPLLRSERLQSFSFSTVGSTVASPAASLVVFWLIDGPASTQRA